MTQVDTLGNPSGGNLAELYLLSLDEKAYSLNADGDLWLPVESPGWPRHDGANDWDFETSESNSGWAWVNQNSCTADWGSAVPSKLRLQGSTSAAYFSIYKVTAPTLTDKRLMTLVQPAYPGDGSDASNFYGLVVRNSSSTNAIAFALTHSRASTGASLFVMKWVGTTWQNPNPFEGSYGVLSTLAAPVVLGIRFTSTTMYFGYCPYFLGAEGLFIEVYSEALSTFISSIDEIGLGIYKNSGSTNTAYFDWLRLIAA